MLDSSLLIFIQIVSESFPVSSSGHSALAACVIAYYNGREGGMMPLFSSAHPSMLLAHVPTIFIVALFFRRNWIPLLCHCIMQWRLIMRLLLYTCVADGITVLCYILMHRYPLSMPLWSGFAITGLLLFSLRWCRHQGTLLTMRHMVLLGGVQGIALVPGISRFGIVYTTCRLLGIRSSKAFGVTWMLQWPLMIGGVVLGLFHQLPFTFIIDYPFLIKIIAASLCAYGGLSLMYWAAVTHMMWLVTFYMLVPIIISLILHC